VEFTASPSDLIRAVQAAREIDANPVTLAGKLIGLGADEQEAGIPSWAWMTVALGLGLYLGVRYGTEVRQKLRRVADGG
jgi:hypothetical protein